VLLWRLTRKPCIKSVLRLDDNLVAPVTTPLPKAWDSAPPYNPDVQSIGDAWISSGASLGMRVPASVLPSRNNVLLNPAHPDIQHLREVEQGPLPWPPRPLA
jgi:RES domain-containing protein